MSLWKRGRQYWADFAVRSASARHRPHDLSTRESTPTSMLMVRLAAPLLVALALVLCDSPWR
jgi:hypothetical protein